MSIRLAPGAVVMGIESSCDETGVGLVRLTDGAPELLGHALASSADEHARFGGVVPEIASRAHLEAMTPTVHQAFANAGLRPGEVDAIAVTAGPGLAGSLLVGVAAAKAYAAAWDVPLFGVNHLAGHVAADTLEHGPLPKPALALLVSGGHTQLLRVDDLAGSITEIGTTIDDAAGEAYDKVARLLGLGYPGGPVIDRLAADGDPAAIAFPRGLTGPRDTSYDFSFSGLKTAVARHVEGAPTGRPGGRRRRCLRLVPGRGGRRAHREDRQGGGRSGHRHGGDRGWSRGERRLAGAGRAALRRGRSDTAGAPDRAVHRQRRDDRRGRRARRRCRQRRRRRRCSPAIPVCRCRRCTSAECRVVGSAAGVRPLGCRAAVSARPA